MSNDYSSSLLRIRAYARSVSERAAAGDFDAALIALNMIHKLLDETAEAILAEQERRQALEKRDG